MKTNQKEVFTLKCDQCGRIETKPYDIGDKGICGGIFKKFTEVNGMKLKGKYSIGDQVIDEDGCKGYVCIRYDDGDICFWKNDAAHPNPVIVEEVKVKSNLKRLMP